MEDCGHAMGDGLPNFLKLPNDISTHDTSHRLFSALAPDRLLDSFLAWTQSIRQAMGEGIVAMDGKALRRTMKKGGMPCVVSAWAIRNGLALGQLRGDEKLNEITAVPQPLRARELDGCIVTLDAMGCQRMPAASWNDSSPITTPSGSTAPCPILPRGTNFKAGERASGAIAIKSSNRPETKGNSTDNTTPIIL